MRGSGLTRVLICMLLWLAAGVPGVGWMAADSSTLFPDQSIRRHLSMSCVLLIGGPVGTIVGFLTTGFGEHGMCFTVKGCRKVAEKARAER